MNASSPAPSTAQTSGAAPSDNMVHNWQSELQASFGTSHPDAGFDRFARIREGLAAGRFGGLPLLNPAADSLALLLEHLNWTGSVDKFARAMPHFPESFDLSDIDVVLVRLGYDSRTFVGNSEQLRENDAPFLLVDDPDSPIVVDFVSGRPTLIYTDTTEPLAVGRHRFVSFHPKQVAEDDPQQSWLGSQIRRFSRSIRLLFVMTGFINLMVLVTSFTVMSVYDRVIPSKSVDTLVAILIGLMIAVAVELGFRGLKARLIGHLCGRLEYIVGTSVFAKLLSLPTDMIANVPIGVQITRLGQFETVRDLFAGPFTAIALEIPFIVLFILFLFAVGGPLGFVAVALIAVYAIVGLLIVPPMRRRVLKSSRLRQERQAMLLETVSNIRNIRAAGCEDIWAGRLDDIVERSSEANRSSQALSRLLTTLSGAGVPIAGGATAMLGAALVMQGSLTVGVLVGSMIIIWRVLAPIQQMFMTLTRMSDMVTTIRQIDQMMRIPNDGVTTDSLVRRQFTGAISFDRASFRYPGTTEAALAGLVAKVNPGEFVAVMGASGAGKSTFLRIILDLYHPQSGVVAIDGINVRQIPHVDLRSGVGYVSQSTAMFHGTIAQNLRLAAPAADDMDLRRVASELGILDDIDALPKGFDTLVNHAVRDHMPAGFRQTLAIAQAFLREPQVLLMDEPAQGLDPRIEDHFLKAIARRRGQITVLMVTHRPSHARMADRVMILERGQIAAFDTPDTVLGAVQAAGGVHG